MGSHSKHVFLAAEINRESYFLATREFIEVFAHWISGPSRKAISFLFSSLLGGEGNREKKHLTPDPRNPLTNHNTKGSWKGKPHFPACLSFAADHPPEYSTSQLQRIDVRRAGKPAELAD